MADPLRQILERDREIRRLLNPLETAAAGLTPYDRVMERASAGLEISRLLEERADHEAQMLGFVSAGQYRDIAWSIAQRTPTATERMVEEMVRADMTATQRAAAGIYEKNIAGILAESTAAHLAWERSFRLPGLSEATALLDREINAAADWARSYVETEARQAALHAMGAMTNPWLSDAASMRSVAGFTELQTIGTILKDARPFATEVAGALRPSLGDWRDAGTPTLDTLLDPVARTALYYEHGFSSDVTAFPRPAFVEGLRHAGLDLEEDLEEEDIDDSGDDAEAAFARNRAAFDQLQRFEVAVRQFIDAAMTETFGANWIDTRISKEMSDDWRSKQDKEFKATGSSAPLVEYADFSDYKVIIERGDNWKSVFRPIFNRQTDIQESFQRLYPVRIATMHARMLTQDDELMLTVETRRILRAIQQKT